MQLLIDLLLLQVFGEQVNGSILIIDKKEPIHQSMQELLLKLFWKLTPGVKRPVIEFVKLGLSQ